jgi:hypothetical protein
VSSSFLFSQFKVSTEANEIHSIGTIYNAIQGSNRKDLVEEWARELYPNVWKDIEKLGMYEHEEGHMVIQMPERELKA